MSSILPANSTDLEVSLETSVSRTLPNKIADMWDPDTCPVELLGYLAWGLSVFEWDDSWSESIKRDVIRNSLIVHQHHGTVGSLRLALQSMGYELVQILDIANNIYNGKNVYDGTIAYGDYIPAFLFDVILHTKNPITQAETDRIKARIAIYKNARSQLRNLKIMNVLYDNTFVYDGAQSYNGGIV